MVVVAAILLITGSGVVLSVSGSIRPAGAVAGQWTATTAMNLPREFATSTLLGDGNLLVAGGMGPNLTESNSGEVYDPTTGSWTLVGMEPRNRHSATRLNDGRVLLAGGWNRPSRGVALSSAAIFDPANGFIFPTGSMVIPRLDHSASLLADGRVLVAGGLSEITLGTAQTAAEIFDPATGTWSLTGPMAVPRAKDTATRLADGTVLMTGAQLAQRPFAELYDPASGTFRATGAMASPRTRHTATLLPDGKVLVAGGRGEDTSAELYDPLTGTFIPTGAMAVGRSGGTATLLLDGSVLVAGGASFDSPTPAPTELYDPSTGAWSASGTLGTQRLNHSSTLLRDGKVLAVGGSTPRAEAQKSAELYEPVVAQPQRSVSLTLTKHLIASGVVGGPTPWCVGGATVSILRNRSAVASATTAPDGSYTVRLPDSPAKYQAKVKRSIVNDIPCNAALSPIVKHAHL